MSLDGDPGMPPDSLSTIRDLVVITSTIVGALVAIIGVSAWKRQLRGKEGFEVARRLIRATYAFAESLEKARSPTLLGEYVAGDYATKVRPSGEAQSFYERLCAAYDERMTDIGKCRTDLRVELLEGRILWGEPVRQLYDPLMSLQDELLAAIRLSLDIQRPSISPAERDELKAVQRGKRYVLYTAGRRGDEFRDDLLRCVERIEEGLKKHIGK